MLMILLATALAEEPAKPAEEAETSESQSVDEELEALERALGNEGEELDEEEPAEPAEAIDPETGLPWATWALPEGVEEPLVLDPEMLRLYEARKLEVVDAVTDDPGVTWVVRTGSGSVVDSFHFVELVEDREGQDFLDTEVKQARITAFSVAGVGAAMVLGAIVPVALIDHKLEAPNPDDYMGRVDRSAFETDLDYQEELGRQSTRYQLAQGEFNTAEGRNQDLAWMSVALASGGIMTLSAAPFAVEARVEERRPVAHTYGRERAEELVTEYNLALQQELGLRRGGPPKEVEEDREDWEGNNRDWRVMPQIGPAYVGLTVRF